MEKSDVGRAVDVIMATVANYCAHKRMDQFLGTAQDLWDLVNGDDTLRKQISKILNTVFEAEIGTSTPSAQNNLAVEMAAAPSKIEVIEPPPEPRIITMTDRLAPVRAQILPPYRQIEAWAEARSKYRELELLISGAEIEAIDLLCHGLGAFPTLTPKDMEDGYLGPVLFYGFGGKNNVSDMVLSTKVPWEFIASVRDMPKCDVCLFDNPKQLRPFRGRHSDRPTGFYWKLVQLGHAHQGKSVRNARQLIKPSDWGMGPEGIQFFLTHPHYAELMDGNQYPFIDLPDFEASCEGGGVSPYAPYLYFNHVTGRLGMSSGGVSSPIPTFGSGSLR